VWDSEFTSKDAILQGGPAETAKLWNSVRRELPLKKTNTR